MWMRGKENWKFRHDTVCSMYTVQLWAWLESIRECPPNTPPSTRAPGLLYDVTEFPLIRAFPVPQLPSVIYPKAIEFLSLNLSCNRSRSASDRQHANHNETMLRWNRFKTTLHFKRFTLQKLAYTSKQNVITVRMYSQRFILKQRFISQWNNVVAYVAVK